MSDGCYVYVVAVDKGEYPSAPVKIGVSANPWCRVIEMQTGSPHRLILLHALWLPTRQIAFETERAFHLSRSDNRLHGEWFDLDPYDALAELIGFIDIELWSRLRDVPLFLHTARERYGINKAMRMVDATGSDYYGGAA